MPKIIDIDTEALVRDYKELSLRELSVKHDCSHETVRVYLKRAGVTFNIVTQGRPTLFSLPIQELKERYLRGESVKSLAAEYSCSSSTIYKQLRVPKPKLANKANKANSPRKTRASHEIRDQQICAHWEYIGGTLEELGALYDLGVVRIRQILRKGKQGNDT